MFIFHFLGVGPPCCSILGQFWLCEEAQCVYVCRHLGSPLYTILYLTLSILYLPSYSLDLFLLSPATTSPLTTLYVISISMILFLF